METIKEVFRAYPFAVRRDIGGFVVVAFQVGDVWGGRAWRLSDWKSFGVCPDCCDKESVFRYYFEKIETLKSILSMPVVGV